MLSTKELIEKLELQHSVALDDPNILEACRRLGWHLSAPYAQWDYDHVIKKNGGIIPFSLSGLIEELKNQQKSMRF